MDGREMKSARRSVVSSGDLFQEYLGLNGFGYIYSPDFIRLSTNISLGKRQESSKSDNLSWGTNGGLFQFRQELFLLPNHPYNLKLYVGRSDEMIRNRDGGSYSALVYEWGARAQYHERSWQSQLVYTHFETISSWKVSSDTFGADLYYYDTLTHWNVKGSYNHYISSGYNGLSNTVKDVFEAHLGKKWDSFRFLSKWNADQHKQEGNDLLLLNERDCNESRERWEWFNQVSADLPYNVTSHASYRRYHTNVDSQCGGRLEGAVNDVDSVNFDFAHHLYKSLKSNLNSSYVITNSFSGKSEQKNIALGTGYTKIIRWGSIGTGLSAGVNDIRNSGGTAILGEEHKLTLSSPTSFALNSTQVDPETIRVSAIDPSDNNMHVLLIRDVHYKVEPVGESYEIRFLPPLPPSLTEPLMEYKYTVDYVNISSEYSMRGTSWGGSLRMTLFDGFITSYVGYRQSKQHMFDGSLPGVLNSSKSYEAGFSINYRNMRGEISKHWRHSGAEDEERLLAYFTASGNVNRMTGSSCTLSYENRITKQIYTVASSGVPLLGKDIYSGYIQAYTSWPKWNLNASVSVNYSLYQGLGESTSTGVNSKLSWKIGRMDMDIRLAYNDSESDIENDSSKSSYYTAWIVVRRKIF